MSEKAERKDQGSSARGEAAWKEQMQSIADRNQAARKTAKGRREAHDKQRRAARASRVP